MKLITLALNKYREDHGAFPPIYTTDEQGKPMHSWRALILRYVDAAYLHYKYDFNEPWNGPNNSKFASQMPIVFECEHSRRVGTPYIAVSSSENKAAFNLKDPNSIVLIELHCKAKNWLEPDQISIDEVKTILADPNRRACSKHINGITYTRQDGSFVSNP